MTVRDNQYIIIVKIFIKLIKLLQIQNLPNPVSIIPAHWRLHTQNNSVT